MAPYRVSNLNSETSLGFTPISLRQSSNKPTQSPKVPIFNIEAMRSLPYTLTQWLFCHRYVSGSTHRKNLTIRPVALFCFEGCRTLLHIGIQTFFGVFTLEKYLLVLALERQR